jgi:hypothetical protein
MLGLTNGQTFFVLVIAIFAAAGTICSVVSSIWGSPFEHSSESNEEEHGNQEEDSSGLHR